MPALCEFAARVSHAPQILQSARRCSGANREPIADDEELTDAVDGAGMTGGL